MIKTIITDYQEIVREGSKMIISLHKELEIVEEASNGQELLVFIFNNIPDVLLMDIQMPVMDGIAATEIVKERHSDIKNYINHN